MYETNELDESFQVVKQDIPIILHQDYVILDDYLYPVNSNDQQYVNVNGTFSNKRTFVTNNFSLEIFEKMHEGKDLIIYRQKDDVRLFVSSQRKIRVIENNNMVTRNGK